MGFKSFFMLGFFFALHLLKKLAFWRRRPGADRFIANYSADGVTPVSAEEARHLDAWLRCTGCGLCEAVCPLEAMPSGPLEMTFAELAHRSWRDRTAQHLVATSAANLATCAGCGACEAVCPERIPLLALAEAVARRGPVA